MPVSTAEVTRRRCTSPCSSTSASTTVAMKLPNDGCTQTPRPTRAGSGWPQLDFSAARSSAASRRGFLPSMPRRNSIGILARLARQLVHEAFDREHVVVGADPAPEAGRHRRRLGPHIFDMEVGNVVGHVDGAIDRVDIDALLERRRQPARNDRRAGDLVFPADDLAVRQGRGDRVAIDRAIDVVLDVLLAGPHHLDRPVDLLGDANGRDHHVGLEPAAEAAAEQMLVDGHLLDRKAGGLRRLRLHPRHDLRAGPDLAGSRA